MIRDSDSESLRQQVFALLEKDHGLKPKNICKLLDLPYFEKAQLVANYCSEWRSNYRNRLAQKCLKFHRVRGWLFGLAGFDRERARGLGVWRVTGARNRMLVFADGFGRVEWFETGRINFWVRKPASWARLKQLLANAFMWTGLVSDVRVFEAWVASARFKGEHLTVDLGVPLPYSRTELLKESNGVVAKTGDLSHPSCVELEFNYPDWAERNELALKQLREFFRDLLGLQKENGVGRLLREDYSS